MNEISDDLKADRSLASDMPNTWDVFFGKFGRLTPIQRKTIPVILSGHDCLVISPTASGKTEAVAAPLMELRHTKRQNSTVLYISPTRALVNDLYERLYSPVKNLGYRVARRTGDNKDKIAQADIILTTPESFDSLLCRGSIPEQKTHALANVRAVVIDEIHLIHGSARGEQLRWLLRRLKSLRRYASNQDGKEDDDIQIIALSATIPNPSTVKNKFLPDAEITKITGSRKIDVVSPESENPSTESSLLKYLSKLEIPEKILVFCNTRKRVDSLAQTLRSPIAELSYEVNAHHGSLSPKERESAERAIKTKTKIVTFATTTLELGIDIGDIDLVVLDGPPDDIQSLLQRIGRGNRRTDKTRVMPCSGTPLEAIVQSAMIQAASDGWMGSYKDGPHFAVAIQQIASYIYQSPTGSRRRRTIADLFQNDEISPHCDRILDNMLEAGELDEKGQGLALGEDWLRKSELGQIHSNIESVPGLQIVDEGTGAVIADGLSFTKGPQLGVAGLSLDVRRIEGNQIGVRRSSDGKGLDGSWGYTSRRWMKGSDPPQSVKKYLSIPESVWPVVKSNGNHHIFHFGGTIRSTLLKLTAQASSNLNKDPILKHNEWFITLNGVFEDRPTWINQATKEYLEPLIENRLDSLENQLGRPRANRLLPDQTRAEELLGWLNLESECDFINNSEWEEPTDNEISNLLLLIAKTILKSGI